MSSTLIEVEGLTAAYGAIKALRSISLSLTEGEAVAVIGANGAGKTTLMRVLSGIMPAASGKVTVLGRDAFRTSPHALAREGLLHIPEGRGTLQTLRVDENLQLAWEIRPTTVGREEALAKAYARFPRLFERREQLAGNLSGGEQQMLAVARALVNRPKLVLLDEPSMGLSPRLTGEVFRALAELRDDGVSMLIVEQNVERALKLTSRALILSHGTFTAAGKSADLVRDPAIVASYLGREGDAAHDMRR